VIPVVGVHGIWNHSYLSSAGGDLEVAGKAISKDWAGWVAQGLGALRQPVVAPAKVPVAYYADCLRRAVEQGTGDPAMLDPFAQELFAAWVDDLRLEVLGPGAAPLTPEGRLTKWLLRQPAAWLAEHFGAMAVSVVSAAAGELATYLDPEFADLRQRARNRVIALVTEQRPRVLVAHSLGSVVAYEALCAIPDVRIEMFVTLGSPLGLGRVVFERLEPPPFGKGIRPPGVRYWLNIADRGDPVAVPPGLGTRFDGVDADRETSIHLVDPHRAKSYLRCAEFASALAPYL
jgi:hypothetical protein